MTTLIETLERIQELDPKLVRIVGNMYGTIYLFDGVPSDNRHEFREAMLDWLVVQGWNVEIKFRTRWRRVVLSNGEGAFYEFSWNSWDELGQCESELHALALCVLRVLEARREEA